MYPQESCDFLDTTPICALRMTAKQALKAERCGARYMMFPVTPSFSSQKMTAKKACAEARCGARLMACSITHPRLTLQMTAKQARAAARCGARFITSPINPEALIATSHSEGALALPGGMTPSELHAICESSASHSEVF